MTTFLLHDDALRSHELRHEIAEPVGDPVVFLEHDGKRIVVGSLLEEPIFETREDVVDEFWNFSSLGAEALVARRAVPEAHDRRRADATGAPATRGHLCRGSGDVPDRTLPTTCRSNGIDVVVDGEAWVARRRRKTPWELEGIERAQRAVETAMLTAARMLREAEPTSNDRCASRARS